MWESRYIARELPARLKHEALFRTLGPDCRVLDLELHETDDYLLTRTPIHNLKLRHRSNTLKLKSRRGVSFDRLERWHTDFEHALPAAAHIWSETLRILDCELESDRVSPAETAESAINVLRPFLRSAKAVRVSKVRRLYSVGRCRVEIAQFTLGEASFATVCVESKDDYAVREALSNLAFVELGPPRNYMEVLHGYEYWPSDFEPEH
jgi:hypothetical protein